MAEQPEPRRRTIWAADTTLRIIAELAALEERDEFAYDRIDKPGPSNSESAVHGTEEAGEAGAG